MPPRRRRLQAIGRLSRCHGTGHALQPPVVDVRNADIAVLALAAAQDDLWQRHRVQQLVVAVEHRDALRGQIFKYLTLGLQNALPCVAQIFDVGVAHVGDNGDIRPYHLAQIPYLPKVVHARLDHRRLVLRHEPQQRQRRADVVVEVPLRPQRLVFLRQHCGDHLLGGSLAHGAGHLYHRQPELPPVPGGQCLQRQPRVGHLNVKLPRQQCLRRFCRQASRRPGLQRLFDIGVAVEAFPHQRDEQRFLRHAAAVGGHVAHRRAAALQHRAAHRGADGLYRQRHHARAAFRAASDSSTIFSHNSP